MMSAAPRVARRPRTLAAIALLAAASAPLAVIGGVAIAQEPPHSAELDAAIVRAAKRHGVPERLVRRIVMRESRYNPRARNHLYWGLMQISFPTAKSMGFKGTPEQLLNPVTNLAYAVPYLANAFIIAGKQEDAAVRLYASGYYATAKARGVLGLLRTADSKPLNGVPDEPISGPTAVASADTGGWSLFGSSTPAPVAPAPQQLAYAATPDPVNGAAAQAEIRAVARAAPARATAGASTSDKNADDGIAMIAGRDGTLTPPRRWQHDGGLSVVSRGEQSLERVAAYRLGGNSEVERHSRKTAVYAQLDRSGTSAPAATATASTFYAAAPAADPAQAAATEVAASQPAALDADGSDRPKHRHRRHRSDDE